MGKGVWVLYLGLVNSRAGSGPGTHNSDDVQAIISRLLTRDESLREIPIMGMEGIGKTTLAKLIFNHKAVIYHFPFAVWTSDSYRLLLRNKTKLVAVDSCAYQMQRLKVFFVNNRSLIVQDDSYIPQSDARSATKYIKWQ